MAPAAEYKWYAPPRVSLCLQMAWAFRCSAAHRPSASFIRRGPNPRTEPANMPCRKENYIFLEQSVTVDSKEVDALVTKIGEALQLHNNNGTGHHHHLHGLTAGATTGSGGGGGGGSVVLGAGAAAGIQRGHGCCLRLRSRGHHRGSSRASPYHIPGSSDQEWDQIRPWSKKRRAVEEDDPHRLLQELILSGNLIKEAVRRLQFSGGDCAENVSC